MKRRFTEEQIIALLREQEAGAQVIAMCQIAVAIEEQREVAVGKRVSPFPPRRSRRALLTHRAPPSGSGVEAVTG